MGLDWEELSRETRASWMSLIEALELSPEEREIEILLLESAKKSLSVVLGSLESCIAGKGHLPWSCQSKSYMRLASATYAPLSIEDGDLFSAYCIYFEALRHRLSPWLDNVDPEVVVNSILVIARNEYQALERHLRESKTEAAFLLPTMPTDVLRIAQEVPRCPVCGQLMVRDNEGDWFCENCQIKDASCTLV